MIDKRVALSAGQVRRDGVNRRDVPLNLSISSIPESSLEGKVRKAFLESDLRIPDVQSSSHPEKTELDRIQKTCNGRGARRSGKRDPSGRGPVSDNLGDLVGRPADRDMRSDPDAPMVIDVHKRRARRGA